MIEKNSVSPPRVCLPALHDDPVKLTKHFLNSGRLADAIAQANAEYSEALEREEMLTASLIRQREKTRALQTLLTNLTNVLGSLDAADKVCNDR